MEIDSRNKISFIIKTSEQNERTGYYSEWHQWSVSNFYDVSWKSIGSYYKNKKHQIDQKSAKIFHELINIALKDNFKFKIQQLYNEAAEY
jgi:hypothetical protein